MPFFNKYNIGDLVVKDLDLLIVLQIHEVWVGVPEKKGNYLYYCKVFENGKISTRSFYLREDLLFLVRQATIDELNRLMEEALRREEYEKADSIKKLRNNTS